MQKLTGFGVQRWCHNAKIKEEARGYLKENANDNGHKKAHQRHLHLKPRSIIKVSQPELRR